MICFVFFNCFTAYKVGAPSQSQLKAVFPLLRDYFNSEFRLNFAPLGGRSTSSVPREPVTVANRDCERPRNVRVSR